MTCPPLCVIQARLNSTRLPRKMLQVFPHEIWHQNGSDETFGYRLVTSEESLITRAHRIACEAFGKDNVVVAIPATDYELEVHLLSMAPMVEVFLWDGPEADVLGRFHACAHRYRWHPDSVIVRYTPDDPFKSVEGLRRVAAGERLPVEIGGEAFTLAMLDEAQRKSGWLVGTKDLPGSEREHITHALFPTPPPPCPPGVWTVDSAEDLEAARARIAEEGA